MNTYERILFQKSILLPAGAGIYAVIANQWSMDHRWSVSSERLAIAEF